MPKPLATQLYTFRDTTRPGVDGLGLDPATLAAIAEIGFLGVETVDVPGGDPLAARRAIEAAGLQVASAHTWTKLDDLDAFDRASGAVAELGSSSIILSGFGFDSVGVVDAFADRLNAASEVAGRHGLALGYHNHSAEMRPVDGVPVYRRLLERVDPAVAFQVDIFWVQVGGLAPGPVIAELGERVVSLHVKDGVTLPSDAGAEPFVNVPVGQGVIDRRRCRGGGRRPAPDRLADRGVRPLRRTAARGRRRLLRLPGLARPRPRVGRVTAVQAARVGIVGCGNVTDLYLRGCATLPAIELAACADLDAGRAAALSAKGGFPAVAVDALLADPDIEIVLNLTPPTAHVGVSRAAIAAGKHVYSEKPFATTRADAASILADGAAAGVVVGGAPDTFLGGGLQTARALIDEGAIGEPIGANAAVMHPGPERWHPNPDFFYGPGGGPLLDVGPYYIAALVSLLGPVAAVSAEARGTGAERRISSGPRAGDDLRRPGPDPRRGGLPVRLGGDRRVHGVVRRGGQRLAAHRDPRHGGLAQPRRPEPFRRGGPAAAVRRGRLDRRPAPVRRRASGAGSASRT